MSDPLGPVMEALRAAGANPADPTRLATVTAKDANGYSVRFDGESVASSRSYKAVSAANVGDRVLMIRVGSTWLMAGHVMGGNHAVVSRSVTVAVPSLGNVPNDNTQRVHFGPVVVPWQGDATSADVQFQFQAIGAANGIAFHGYLQVLVPFLGWTTLDEFLTYNTTGYAAMAMGGVLRTSVRRDEGDSSGLNVRVLCSNDAGSAGWIYLNVNGSMSVIWRG